MICSTTCRYSSVYTLSHILCVQCSQSTVYTKSCSSTSVCFFLLKTSQRYLSEYENRCTQEIYYATEDGGRAYDTTWILALALNSTMAMVTNGNINGTGCENMSGSLLPLDQFNYTNQKMGCLIQWNIQRTNSVG